jgi:hypothetical protein
MGYGNGTGGSDWNLAVEFESNDGFGEEPQEEDEDSFEDKTVEECEG